MPITLFGKIVAALGAASLLTVSGCASKANMQMDDPGQSSMKADWIETEVMGSSPLLRGIRAEPERYRVQIMVSEVVPGDRLRTWSYRADTGYFYPASTVKLVAAIAALNELRALSEQHDVTLTPDTPMRFYPQFGDTEIESTDPTNIETGTITLRHLIRKVFLVSDNEAYNKMFELVGSEKLNALIERVDPAGGRVVHRLSEGRTAQENTMLPAIDFLDQSGSLLLALPERVSTPVFESDADIESLPGYPEFELGRAYTTGSERIDEPFVFRGKNRVSLASLHALVALVVEPHLDGGRLGLHEDDRTLLIDAMRTLPRESDNPKYDPKVYPDEYQKFFLPGLRRALGQDAVLVANKLGRAYGFSSDTAHILHAPSGRAIVLTAVLYTNDNATLNDGIYEYDLADRALAEIAERIAEKLLVTEPDDSP